MLRQLRRLQNKIRIIRKLLPIILSLHGWDYGEGEKLLVGYLEILRDNLNSDKAFTEDAKFRAYQINKWINLYNTITDDPYTDIEDYNEYSDKVVKARNTVWELYKTYSPKWWD